MAGRFGRFDFGGRGRSRETGTALKDLIYETSDGFITAGAVSDAEWKGMCKALDKEEWLTDERFSSARARGINVKLRLEMTAEVKDEHFEYWLTSR